MASGRGFTALLAAVVAVATLFGIVTGPADATFAGKSARIAYQVTYHSWQRQDIFTVRPDGTGERRLTFSGNSQNPIWSPSGRRIAYERSGGVWVMRADGSGKHQLIPGRLVGWMPNGRRILVVRGLDGPEGVDPSWLLVRISTGDVEQLPIDLPLAAGLSPPYHDFNEWSYVSAATLSPNGEPLALILTRYDIADDGYSYPYGSFFAVRLDGTGLRRIGSVYEPNILSSPDWSPSGRQLVYAYNPEPRGDCYDVVTSIRLDGSPGSAGLSQLCFTTDPTWSPDANEIALPASSPTWARHSLMISKLDGSRITTVLSSTVRYYSHPDWRGLP
jgi:Tol biopolymer transport system component